ncbi:hypothetical protein [Amphritea sp. HPY]|uniref:hypothetical protein n=1 Tax=Amphritea sp. HPY TaxID=3421652 RepID=UPI003D7DF572
MSNTFTALCIHEHFYENQESMFAASMEDYRETNGSLEWREVIEQLAQCMDDAWDQVGEDVRDSLSCCWDFDIVPALLDKRFGGGAALTSYTIEDFKKTLRELAAAEGS